MRVQVLVRAFAIASVVFIGAIGSARARDDSFMLTTKILWANDPSATVTAEEA